MMHLMAVVILYELFEQDLHRAIPLYLDKLAVRPGKSV
jgi:hypothetical protein